MKKNALHALTNTFQRMMHSPFLFQAVSLGFLFVFIFGFRPENFSQQQQAFFQNEWNQGFDKQYTFSDDGFIINQVENIISTEEKRTRNIEYVVKSGDNISKIAHKFGLKVSTVLWANDLTSKSNLQIGDSIQISPIDGVYYVVKKHDTLSEIAKAHGANLQKVYAYNKKLNNKPNLKVGDKVFIPEASKTFIPQKIIVQKPKYKGSAPSKQAIKASTGSGVVSTGNLKFIRPTKGTLTQGYHSKHYALDIANRMNTPIYAVADGTVITSQNGWNYGYGNYIIVDHGNGVTTLYGHNNKRKVAVGDTVKKGQLIALMGNSGRVFGRTGIHVHFEVRINGKKKNPNNYFN